MFIGQVLYILGMLFVFGSILVLIIGLFTGGGGISVYALFAILNGLIAMGVGEIILGRKRSTD